MPVKWVQCRWCGHTRHIKCFPVDQKKYAQSAGQGICDECLDKHDTATSQLLQHGSEFILFLKETLNG